MRSPGMYRGAAFFGVPCAKCRSGAPCAELRGADEPRGWGLGPWALGSPALPEQQAGGSARECCCHVGRLVGSVAGCGRGNWLAHLMAGWLACLWAC